MKRFITKTIFLVLPLSILLVVQEFALRQVPNDYSYKNQWLANNSKCLKILSLGSSHGFFGIQPIAFSKSAFNDGHVSQSLLFDEFIFDKFFPYMDSLECVILPISYFAIRSKGLQYGEEKWRVKNYTIYYDCPYFRYQPEFALESYRFEPRATVEALSGSLNYRGCDSLGRGTAYTLESRSKDWAESGPVAMKRHTNINYSQNDIDENIAHINHIIETCATKNVMVILVTTPTYHSYYDILNQEQLNQLVTCCQNIADSHKNAIYLNWLKHPNFDEHDFYDADHLNEFGAIKLTKLLDQEIILHHDEIKK